MSKRFSLELLCLISLFVLSSVVVLAEISVGVKKGDWIEYNITYTGSPLDEYPKWVRIEIMNIQGANIAVKLTVELLNGTFETISPTYDLETGVPDLLIIPPNLDAEDEFHHEDFGNITIAGTNESTIAGAKRTVNYVTIGPIAYTWDKKTGIILQTVHSTDTFTQTMLAYKTNMWQSQIFGLEPTIVYAVIIGVIVIVALIAFFLYRKSK